ncbi:bacteriorhodopsin [Natronomonas sp. F2-12]|jgi:sensory rhodopsin|uniref:Bacteriorhodopsin n=1 Tax=Natronomonas aquatica TaxID=2841590 RepID=A0A9R1CVJ5_9EURY|nr:bacteriorhodopsin [Natronomonas aquatica]MCQ4334950.1 bacteriorhodopsin [Natronomonas aquatica]
MPAPEITVAYSLSFVGLLFGIGIATALLRDETVDNDVGAFAWLLIIPGFAAISYLMMVLDIAVITVDGNDVYLFRYLDWLVTTPILVGYVAYVAGAPRRWIFGVGVADALMIAVGAIAALQTGIGTWIGFGVSSAFHLVLLGILYTVLPQYAKQNRERFRLFKILQNHVGLLWIAYPVIWLTSPAGIGAVSVAGTAMIIAYLDLVAKTPYVYFVWTEREAFSKQPATPEPEPGATAEVMAD